MLDFLTIPVGLLGLAAWVVVFRNIYSNMQETDE